MHQWIFKLAITTLLCGLGLLAFWSSEAVPPVTASNTHNADSNAPTTGIAPAHFVLDKAEIEKTVALENPDIPVQIFAQLPASMRGVPLPEALKVDENGQLLITTDIKQLFDFYLSATAEEPLTLIVARIKHQLQNQLPQQALQQAEAILAGYLQYRNRIAEILAAGQDEAVAGQRSFEQIVLLKEQIALARGTFFDAQVNEVFFARQDEYDNYILARQLLAANSGLTNMERQQAKRMLEANTAPWLVEQQQSANRLNHYRQLAAQLNKEDDDQALRDLRERQFGVDAADRLAKLERQRAQWNAKVDEYHHHLKALLEAPALSTDEQSLKVVQLRARYFSTLEQRRIAAIDHHRFGLD